eukprot:1181006-Prorocentrum_minimum.AAC.3
MSQCVHPIKLKQMFHRKVTVENPETPVVFNRNSCGAGIQRQLKLDLSVAWNIPYNGLHCIP